MTKTDNMVTPLWCKYLRMGYSVSMKNKIVVHRKKLGVSCNDLAGLIGWNQQRLSRYELGDRDPGLKECRLIVWALNNLGAKVTLDEVFPDDE